MYNKLNKVYVVIYDNKVLLLDTNLKDLLISFKTIEPDIRNYNYYWREFSAKKKEVTEYVNPSEKKYFIQLITVGQNIETGASSIKQAK